MWFPTGHKIVVALTLMLTTYATLADALNSTSGTQAPTEDTSKALNAIAHRSSMDVPGLGSSNATQSCKVSSECTTPTGSYCRDSLCQCKIFHENTNGVCKRITCKTYEDCRVGQKNMFVFVCESSECKCMSPGVLKDDDTICGDPLWLTIMTWITIIVSIISCIGGCFACYMGWCSCKSQQSKGKVLGDSSIKGPQSKIGSSIAPKASSQV